MRIIMTLTTTMIMTIMTMTMIYYIELYIQGPRGVSLNGELGEVPLPGQLAPGIGAVHLCRGWVIAYSLLLYNIRGSSQSAL